MLSPHRKINFQIVQEIDFLTLPALCILKSCIKMKIRPKKTILLFLEMRVTIKIFPRVAANLFF